MKWTVARVPVRCRSGEDWDGRGCVIPPGEPIAEFLGGLVRRCAEHALVIDPSCVPDRQEIELERWRLEKEIADARTAAAERQAAYDAEQARRQERRDLERTLAEAELVDEPAARTPKPPARDARPGLFDDTHAAASGDR